MNIKDDGRIEDDSDQKHEFGTNPCVPADTWIRTLDGSKQVSDLVEKQFIAVVDGRPYKCKTGFIKTGTKQTFKIVTDEGFEVCATKNHKFMTISNKWVKLRNLKVGDELRINNHETKSESHFGSHDFSKGWLLGSLFENGEIHQSERAVCLFYYGEDMREMAHIANAHLSHLGYIDTKERVQEFPESTKVAVYNKELFHLARKYVCINDRDNVLSIEDESFSFRSGFLRGLFEANCTVQNDHGGYSILLTSFSIDELRRAQRMLLSVGVYSNIRQDIDNDESKLFQWRHSHELKVSPEFAHLFGEHIGFHDNIKQENIMRTDFYKPCMYSCTIRSIEPDIECDVYDATVDKIHAFDANGFYAHNCCNAGTPPAHQRCYRS